MVAQMTLDHLVKVRILDPQMLFRGISLLSVAVLFIHSVIVA